MKVVVLDDYPDSVRQLVPAERLQRHDVTIHQDSAPDEEALVRRLQGAEAALLIQQRTPLRRAVIERLPALRFISQTGRNLGHVDVAACTERGILISAQGSGQSAATAELTWGLILSVLREIPQQAQRLREGHWLNSMGTTLAGKTLGIYSFGKIGALVAGYGRAFGMEVICWGRESANARAREAGFAVAPSRRDFFERCDIVSLHLAMNAGTRGIVTAGDLAAMRPEAVLVNTSRAGLIQDGALVAALAAGRPGRAAVDVYEEEPVLGAAHPLLGLPNVLCTPHLGYSVRETYERLLAQAFDNIDAFASGSPIHLANPEALRRG